MFWGKQCEARSEGSKGSVSRSRATISSILKFKIAKFEFRILMLFICFPNSQKFRKLWSPNVVRELLKFRATRTDLRSKVPRREVSPEWWCALPESDDVRNVTRLELFFYRDRSQIWNHLSHLDPLFEPFWLSISIFGVPKWSGDRRDTRTHMIFWDLPYTISPSGNNRISR